MAGLLINEGGGCVAAVAVAVARCNAAAPVVPRVQRVRLPYIRKVAAPEQRGPGTDG